MKLRRMKIRRTKSVPVFWATRYKVNVLTRNIKHLCDPLPHENSAGVLYSASKVPHTSLVIINWLTAGQIED